MSHLIQWRRQHTNIEIVIEKNKRRIFFYFYLKLHTFNRSREEKFETLCRHTTFIIRPPRVSTTETLSVYTTKPKLNIIFKEFMSHVEHAIKHGFTVFIQLEVCPFAVQ